MRGWQVLVLGIGGCGRIHFDPIGAEDATGDAAPGCDPTAPFGAPQVISELSDPVATEGTLRLLPDELSGYYWSDRGRPSPDIFYVSRPTRDAPFTSTLVTDLSTGMNEFDPTMASDGSLFVFRRDGDLYSAIPTSPLSFSTPVAIAVLNTAPLEAQAFLPVGRDELYFQSQRSNLGDIYVSTRTGTTFGAPIVVPGLVTPSEEGDGVVSANGLTIYFRSDRPSAFGGFNIYVATRTSTTLPFEAAQLVPNVNSSGSDDGPSWLSVDGCRLYLSSNILGSNDIFVATRGP